ncbi:hypothetical protein KOI35_17490 [Actinoplanes bogorensis]|uniref:MaoC-like domain-containing protein n=1 Tax=Paractinoplanes bogorensis TaxID=1610840 RepID=A0ABS5YQF2_9ACTN|nr:MaoC/PaaZ C-terminal domain-containing protein [Actinoplanes bogorensis]MBU2665301.1 hypothetical protein [Actinoplanes bogorensis]
MATIEVGPGSGGASTWRAALGLIPRSRPGELPGVEFVRRGVTVDVEHLAAYGKICGFRLNDTLPATYPHVLAFPLGMRLLTASDFPFPAVGLVHIGNTITLRRPLDVGETFDISVRAANLRPHDRGRQVDLLATASAGGDEVWTSVSTYLSRSGPASARTGKWEPPASTAEWRVPPRIGNAYAGVSGDRNPIHTSSVVARLFGFPRRIAHGMWSKARCLAALEGRLPGAYTVDVQFRQPILLPSTVRFAYGDGRFELFGTRPHLAGQVTPA